MPKPDMILFANDSRGVYIPKFFADCVRRECVANVTPENWADLEAGPDSETYWDTWLDVCDYATVTDHEAGVTYTLWQDGDLWLIPEGMEWSDKAGTFVWPDSSDDE